MPTNLLQIIESTKLDADEIAARTKQIHAAVLSQSRYIDDPNFDSIHPDDLELLFAEYDNSFFDGQIKQSLGKTPLPLRPVQTDDQFRRQDGILQ